MSPDVNEPPISKRFIFGVSEKPAGSAFVKISVSFSSSLSLNSLVMPLPTSISKPSSSLSFKASFTTEFICFSSLKFTP